MTVLHEDLPGLGTILKGMFPEPHPGHKNTADTRREAHRQAIESTDIDHLLALQDKMTTLIDTITANDLGDTNLSPEHLSTLMAEFLDQRDIKELLDARYQMIRSAIFAHLDTLGGPGTPGEVPVPTAGKKFVRQGGRQKFALDEEALIAALGPQRATRVLPTRVVPEHVERTFDTDAALALIAEDPSVLEVIRAHVTEAGRTPLSFHVREL